MIKIVHLISSLTRGGRERQLATIVANTDQKEYPTKVVFFNKHKNSYFEEYGLKDFSIQLKSNSRFARLKELNSLLKNENPDIVYTWGNGESVSILLLKPFHKFKFINGSVRHGIRSLKLSHYFRSIILHLSPNIVANSFAGLKANYLRRGKVIYNGVDPKFIGKLTEGEKKEKRGVLLNPDSEISLLISVANLVPYKDYFSIIEALKTLKEKGFKFQYIILGEGPLRNKIEDTITKYDLSEDIKLPGNVQNVSDYLKVADIFLHSSKGEGCSNAILEAMAAGLPIIASETGGTPENVSEENGFLFKYQDYRQLAHLTELCLNNGALCQKLGQNSLQIINERFSIQRMMADYYTIINQVVKKEHEKI